MTLTRQSQADLDREAAAARLKGLTGKRAGRALHACRDTARKRANRYVEWLRGLSEEERREEAERLMQAVVAE